MGPSRNPVRIGTVLLQTCLAGVFLAAPVARAITPGGDLTVTSDYIFRGISQSADQPAVQGDLHLSTTDGTFAGVFASTLRKINHHGADYELEEYLGHRFDLSPLWSTTVSAVNYSYRASNIPFSNDYQEISAALSYLDLWTVSFAVSPNSVRYAAGYRLGRYTSYVADASSQLPLIGPLFATGGIGYYRLAGPFGTGYAYGNAGLALEWKAWRLDAAYYVTQVRSQYLFPYGEARNHFAATLSWHF